MAHRAHRADAGPRIIIADEALIRDMDDKPMRCPTRIWGYGFPIGGVAAFDPAEGGVVSAGGVGSAASARCGPVSC